MIEFIVSVLALIVTLGILVTIHEFGHFWVARRCGVKVLRFSIGMGKAVKSWIGRDGVEYVIAPIPLGGYVKMLGQEDIAVADTKEIPTSQQHLCFAYKPLWQRMAIVAAGPIANFLLAIFIYWLINISYGINGIAPVINGISENSSADHAGLQVGDEIIAVDSEETIIWQQVSLQMLNRLGETGELVVTVNPYDSSTSRDITIPIQAWLRSDVEPDPVTDLGIVRLEIPARIAEVVTGGRAERDGLRAGDEIISVNGESILGWSHWVAVIRSNPELALDVIVKRGESEAGLEIRPELVRLSNGTAIGRIGASVQETALSEILDSEMQRHISFNAFTAIQPALQETWNNSVFVLDSIKKMVIGLISVRNINGPITIAQVAGETASYGLEVYLGFLALLSICLGVFNLLPIPVLDGGHLFYYTVEAIMGRPVPERVQTWGLQLGLSLIFGIMILAIYNDVNRLL
ncbi:MAG TPA: RIP metalloprotease RseP [Gammaproteobacteria bacterium]|nr:RIP metalloprotease RseP [Gammaproteobacteria bacterium]|tara:strand:- start:2449 stop:3837 length:1389 start_codon:yes stop_codon:yes gene_type:complete